MNEEYLLNDKKKRCCALVLEKCEMDIFQHISNNFPK
jgi:hypothetical protein